MKPDARMALYLASRGPAAKPASPASAVAMGAQGIPAREPDRFVDPPSLGDDKEADVDFETDGVRWWNGHRPGGLGVRRMDGSTFYLAWGHRGGGNNISEEGARAWMRDQLAGKRLYNLSMGFEVHMSRVFGVDLEEIGCQAADVAHWAAIVDDHRREFSLAALVRDLLPGSGERKVEEVNGVRLDPSRMMEYPASVVAVRAMADVRQVGLLRPVLRREIERLSLGRVAALESAVLFPTTEMEKNGLPVDVEKLERWTNEVREEVEASRREIAALTGAAFQEDLYGGGGAGFLNPDSGKEMEALFRRLGLEPGVTDKGAPSFTGEVLSRIDHPIIKKIARQGKLLDLLSKYLEPWSRSIKINDGVLRYKLHQCRGDEHGTVRGRYSASMPDGGSTPHQIWKPSKQRKAMGPGRILRELIVPPRGCALLVSADAMQIEYRIFASYTGSRKLRDAYAANPMLQFHEETRRMLEDHRPGTDYDTAKTCNFLTVYGGGLAKLALQLGNITRAQFAELHREYPMDPSAGKWGPPRDHPLLASTLAIREAYGRALPEVGPLSRRAQGLAKERGYVLDVLGRRATFPGGYGAHAALNAVIQPSAAEVMKVKMVEVHARRKELGLSPMLTLHDEWLGGARSVESARGLAEILNAQSFEKFKDIPILWDVKAGPDWASCTSELEAQFEAAQVPEREDQFEGTVEDGTRNGRSRPWEPKPREARQ